MPASRETVEQRATSLLAKHHVERVPVPVEDLAKVLGIVVSYQPFDADDVSGLLFREEGRTPVIGVNSANSVVRQRFTIAHEIGHWHLHEGQRLILDRTVRVNWRDATSSAASDVQEIEANGFAAALLMPKLKVEARLDSAVSGRRLMSDGAVVDRLAKEFRVSRQAMDYRLANLGLSSPAG